MQKGAWGGLDVDICRAVAAAVLGDAAKVSFVPLTSSQRFPAIQSGEVDLLSRNATHTLTRDTELGLNFGPATFYDGPGLHGEEVTRGDLVEVPRRSLGVR